MITFDEWYNQKKEEVGPLTTPTIAAKRLGISRQHFYRIIESGRIKKHKYENKNYVSEKDIEKELARRQTKNIEDFNEFEEKANVIRNSDISMRKKMAEATQAVVVELIRDTLTADSLEYFFREFTNNIKRKDSSSITDAIKKTFKKVNKNLDSKISANLINRFSELYPENTKSKTT
jgi:excisionase family DNA binding protein